MKTLLLVTWIVFGSGTTQPQSHSYQVIFSSEKTCEAARSALLQEANITTTARVSAICAVQ